MLIYIYFLIKRKVQINQQNLLLLIWLNALSCDFLWKVYLHTYSMNTGIKGLYSSFLKFQCKCQLFCISFYENHMVVKKTLFSSTQFFYELVCFFFLIFLKLLKSCCMAYLGFNANILYFLCSIILGNIILLLHYRYAYVNFFKILKRK